MRTTTTLLLILLCSMAFAQKGETFNVKRGTGNIRLIPHIDTLTPGHKYAFTYVGIKPNQLAKVTAKGGETGKKGDSVILRATGVTEPGKCILRFYTDANNLNEPCFEKEFIVKPAKDQSSIVVYYPDDTPPIFFGWDRTLSGHDTIGLVNIQGSEFLGVMCVKAACKILSMKVELKCNGKTQTFINKGDKYSAEIKQALAKAELGCTVTLRDIRFASTTASGDEKKAGPFEVYIKTQTSEFPKR